MKKIVIHKAGDYRQLQIEESADLIATQDQIVVEVKAAGVNYADIIIRWGLYESAKQMVGWPITPGFEFSGIIKSVGSSATSFKAGDEVLGVSLFNAYASQVSVPAHQLYLKPSHLSFVEAAALPAVFLTAYHALLQNVVTRPGMIALVHSAAGGVGSALVQLCKLKKITTIGVVGSSHKVKALRELGCEHIIDKSVENLWKRVELLAPQGVDLCFDANGLSTLKDSYRHLAPTGKLISYGAHSLFPKKGGKINYLRLAVEYLKSPTFNPIQMTSENKSIITFNLSFLFGRKDLFAEGMNDILEWLEKGELHLPPVRTYAFEDVASAHRDLESGQTIGKLVLVV